VTINLPAATMRVFSGATSNSGTTFTIGPNGIFINGTITGRFPVKEDPMTLEDIACKLDELSGEHPDIPELFTLQAEIEKHFNENDRLQTRADTLDIENEQLRRELERTQRDLHRDRDRRDQGRVPPWERLADPIHDPRLKFDHIKGVI
jgi:hypothetical protein